MKIKIRKQHTSSSASKANVKKGTGRPEQKVFMYVVLLFWVLLLLVFFLINLGTGNKEYKEEPPSSQPYMI